MKRLLLALVLLLTSCSNSTVQQSVPIESFAPCSSIKNTGMKADGLFVECLDGDGELALQGIEGPAVISVWASWCTNCEAQRENFIRLYKEAGEKLQVVGIDVEEKKKSDGYNHALKKVWLTRSSTIEMEELLIILAQEFQSHNSSIKTEM